MTNTPPLLELRDISFSHTAKSPATLEGLTFSITDERIGIIGPNGCGKTTLFHIIMGLLPVQKGEILLNGRSIKKEADFRTLRQRVGFLFQDSDDQLFSPTVLEDVAFGPLNLGKSPEDARRISLQTLDNLGLQGFEERITHKLSGGEKKLVALATILSMQPKLLLLDEPSNNLDPKTRERLITILRDLNQPHIIISHDLDFLASTCTRLYTISEKKLLACKEKQIHSHKHIHPFGDQPHQHGT
ncbi:MAG: ABC transporter ATP-binding protein [Desulfocapsa sp.]|nr:MAG: ABC transporter ATP-binding protein [Desulfocapsa sp.]